MGPGFPRLWPFCLTGKLYAGVSYGGAGYYGGRLDEWMMRFVDILNASNPAVRDPDHGLLPSRESGRIHRIQGYLLWMG